MTEDKTAIACWQQFLNRVGSKDDFGARLVEDGIFGPRTIQATKRFQSSRGLQPSGRLDASTLAIAATITLPTGPSLDGFVAPMRHQNLSGKKFNPANRKVGDILWICIHTAECGYSPKSDENIITYLATAPVKASSHYAVDADSITYGVEEKNIAWHAATINGKSIGIELAGFAKQTRAEWLVGAPLATLKNAAFLVGELVKRYGIPIVECGPDELLKNKPGITTHVSAVKAFKDGSHWDPGPGFPMDLFLQFVAQFAA